MSWQDDVREFHRQFGLTVRDRPGDLDSRDYCLRRSLHLEEMDELHHAMLEFNVPEVADAIADLIYVLLGTAVTYGIDIGPIWDAVHAANMAKSGGRQREDGKWEKPAGWRPPDIDGLLRQQGWEG